MIKMGLLVVTLVLLTTGCAGEQEETKPQITLAVCSGAGSLHEDKIWEINEGNYPYTVAVVDYLEAADGDISLAVQNLNKELAAGEGPDMIDLSSFPLDIDLYASKGVFEDLYPYLDEDETLSRNDFVQSILSACEYDGTLVAMMSGFNIKTMYVTEDVMEGQTAWSIEDFYSYIQRIGVAYLESDETVDMETLLLQLCATSFQSFVDYENKVVSFDDPAFTDFLEQCVKQETEKNDGSIVGRIDSVSDFMEHQLKETVMGGTIKYIGFPTLDGSTSGNYINNQTDFMAICSTSDKKDTCWAFLREFLLEDYQSQTYVTAVARAFPTNANALDQLIAYSEKQIYDENNAEITMRSMYTYECRPAEEDEVNRILDLINSVGNSQRADVTLETILQEEVAAFLSGDQDAKSTAKVLQNRVGIYVNEIG